MVEGSVGTQVEDGWGEGGAGHALHAPHHMLLPSQRGIKRDPQTSFKTHAAAGSVKGLTPQQLEELDCHVILGNTYHLENRPGSALVRGGHNLAKRGETQRGGAVKRGGWGSDLVKGTCMYSGAHR